MNSLKRGALIVFEGCDRSGNTTQVAKLVRELNKEGKPTKMIRFPDNASVVGSVINSYRTGSKEVDDHAIHLLFSAVHRLPPNLLLTSTKDFLHSSL